MKKIKLIIFILLIISFLMVLFYGIFGSPISFISTNEIKDTRKLNNDLISELIINNVDTIYDKNNNIYYYTVPKECENKTYILKLELENGYKYKIIDETLNIIKIDYKKAYNIIIYNDKYYYETKIQLTNLPLISITSEKNINDTDVESKFKYINQNESNKLITNNIKIHVRGMSAKLFPKKSYRLNFYNNTFEKEKNVQISNFYFGDSLILDSVYRDPSKIRNFISTQFWNDISQDFTDLKMYNEFVEVFINNEYKGLYVLTEPVNRTKLNLSKSSINDTSFIIKANAKINVKDNIDFKSIKNQIYLEHEIKYPNESELYSDVWNKFLPLVSDYYDSSIRNTDDIIYNAFNVENYIDMVILNSFINNIDNNLERNNYFYIDSLESKKIYIQPWDMEYSFGLMYSQSSDTLAIKVDDYDGIYTIFYHKYAPEINKLLISRYWELRKNILTEEYFDNLLDEYKEELNKGAALRDSNLWYEYHIDKEIEDVRVWIHKRIEYFDEHVKGLEDEKS